MTQLESEEYEALWTWFKSLDASTEAAQARINATLGSRRGADVARSAAPSMRRGAREERKAGRGEGAAVCF